MLTVVCWKWTPTKGYRSTFGPETVNTLAAMVGRHYHPRHRVLCVTDDPVGIDASIEIVPPWNDFTGVPNPYGPRNPSCYRRLRMFHPDIGAVFGERFVSMDLDVVITGDLRPLWDRTEDIVLCGDTNPTIGSHYNGSMILMSAGARPQVWEDFDPVQSPKKAVASRCFGSDQGWISHRLGKGEATWTRRDGVYSFRNDIVPKGLHRLPENARVVILHGVHDPWSTYVQQNCPWAREHYRIEAVCQ